MIKQFIPYLIFCLNLILLLTGCTPLTEAQKKREARIQSSVQYQNNKFVNPNGVTFKLFSREILEVTKEYILDRRPNTKPPIAPPVHQLRPEQWNNHQRGEFSFTWLGHSSILISMKNQLILVDPVLEDRASPSSLFGPKRFHPSPVTAEKLPNIDVVLITHDHYDHLEKTTIIKISEKVKSFIVPLGVGFLLEEWGVNSSKIIELDWLESYSWGPLKFYATPAIHYASRVLFDSNQRLWCSWAIVGKEKRVFISGDSGYFDGFKKIGERLGPFDVTFLKIGAYNDKGSWRTLHMIPEEAGQQHLDLKGRLLVPLHWATFDLALHSWYEPIERLVKFSEEESITLVTPEVGEKIDLLSKPNTGFWWLGLN